MLEQLRAQALPPSRSSRGWPRAARSSVGTTRRRVKRFGEDARRPSSPSCSPRTGARAWSRDKTKCACLEKKEGSTYTIDLRRWKGDSDAAKDKAFINLIFEVTGEVLREIDGGTAARVFCDALTRRRTLSWLSARVF